MAVAETVNPPVERFAWSAAGSLGFELDEQLLLIAGWRVVSDSGG